MEDFEKRVTLNGNASANLQKKISVVETKLASADSSLDDGANRLSQSNLVRTETLTTELENLKLEVAQLKLSSTTPKIDFSSTELSKWFEAKFHAYLEAPKARKIVNDWVETKVHTHQVIL